MNQNLISHDSPGPDITILSTKYCKLRHARLDKVIWVGLKEAVQSKHYRGNSNKILKLQDLIYDMVKCNTVVIADLF